MASLHLRRLTKNLRPKRPTKSLHLRRLTTNLQLHIIIPAEEIPAATPSAESVTCAIRAIIVKFSRKVTRGYSLHRVIRVLRAIRVASLCEDVVEWAESRFPAVMALLQSHNSVALYIKDNAFEVCFAQDEDIGSCQFRISLRASDLSCL